MSFDTPIIFIIFNRPQLTMQVFSRIKEIKPKTLYIIADGPRPTHPADKERCTAARQFAESVDWPCEVIKDYSEVNLGCRLRVSSGLSNAFKLFESAIILEDDCLPHKDFFPFCEELLTKYRDYPQIMGITGTNILCSKKETSELVNQLDTDYYFSRYPHIWGWATWRRAWEKYDIHMKEWEGLRNKPWLNLKLTKGTDPSVIYEAFDNVLNGKTSTWDTQWLFNVFYNEGISIIPKNNLVKNIGCGMDSIHTESDHPFANLNTTGLSFPLKHPTEIQSNPILDENWGRLSIYKRKYTFAQRMKKSFNKRLKKIKTLFIR